MTEYIIPGEKKFKSVRLYKDKSLVIKTMEGNQYVFSYVKNSKTLELRDLLKRFIKEYKL